MEAVQKEMLRLDKGTRYGKLLGEVDGLLATLDRAKEAIAAGMLCY